MFLITFKKGLNTDNSKFEFDSPLTFLKANEMLIDAVTRYKQTGQNLKVSYKIIEIETGESIFNSKILIDRDIPSLFLLIKENANAPKLVIDYVTKVEKRTVIEVEDVIPLNSHVEEKVHLELLKAEKNDIFQQMKKEEKERQQREIEHQKKMKQIQDEKRALEKSLQLKEKEEALKEAQRLEGIRLLEEEKSKAMQLMEEKKNLDKKRKEEHEKRLRQVEEEAKKAEIELVSIQTELEKNNLERKQELQKLEEKKLEADRKASFLKAEGDKDEVVHKQELIDLKETEEAPPVSNGDIQTITAVPKLTVKERLQELDFEEVKSRSIQFVQFSAKGSINGSKKTFTLFKNYHSKRTAEKQEKQKNLEKQLEIDEKLALEKIKFMEELKQDRLKQEKELEKVAKQKAREISQQTKIEDRYRAAKKKRIGRNSFYHNGPVKFIFGTVAIVSAILGGIYYFDLGNTFPILNDVMSYADDFISTILNTIKGS
ncbi:hypothetical protein MPH61_23260 [Peribacillus muralis]|uniref:hypothetical protein n=1 Tax=Peribacillus muralis TaxID=264697 RepID=UPI001F4D3F0C|nr:hypothetical protein [Peribacillus muralis]MCK1995444.1 hypothetical protein [Peribacillus muralis]MCK2016027.1 hypothetical protein [Peribacillus muralis]